MAAICGYTEHQSETWMLERTYHACLRDGGELPVAAFTQAMKTMTDVSVPLSAWQEISAEEAQTSYSYGMPILLYHEIPWKHTPGVLEPWRANWNMHQIIFGNTLLEPEVVSGTTYAIRYLDPDRGQFSNASWRRWFASDSLTIFDGSDLSTSRFLRPWKLFPYTTHYTVLASSGQTYEYASRDKAIEGFNAIPFQEGSKGSHLRTTFPQLCYYHDVTCAGGIYRLEFLGPRMDEPGYPQEHGREKPMRLSRDGSWGILTEEK